MHWGGIRVGVAWRQELVGVRMEALGEIYNGKAPNLSHVGYTHFSPSPQIHHLPSALVWTEVRALCLLGPF